MTGSLEGAVGELTADAPLLKEPEEGAASHGLLPKGTLLRLTGDQKGEYYSVEVELETGTLEGWIREDKLSLEDPSSSQAKQKTAKSPSSPPPKKRYGHVPQDEELLLHRTPSFFYGLIAEGSYTSIRANNGDAFGGMGFAAGAQIGRYVWKNMPLRGELSYLALSGTDPIGNGASFGFIDAGVSLGYPIDKFEIFAKLRYAYAVSVSNLPGALNGSFNSVSQLSSPWASLGGGYCFDLSDWVRLSARATYSLSFLTSPFFFQTFGVTLLLDFQG